MEIASLPKVEGSLWRDVYPDSPIYPSLTRDLEVDVVIVGAGITGLTAGYLLKQSGLKVAVLEKRTIGSGTTGRTTGKVTSQHNLIYAEMVRRLGRDTAQVYADANQAAVEMIRHIVKREKIACDWQDEDNYIFTTNAGTVKKLKEEAEMAKSLGLPSTFVKDTPLPFKVKGAVRFTGQGKINSQKYLLGLAGAVNGGGSFVFEQSKVAHFKDGEPAHVKTDRAMVTAKSIIVASKIPSFPLAARFDYALLEYPTESFGIACKGGQVLQGMYISPDKQHHSILPIEVSGEQIMIIVGAGGNIPGVRLSKEQRYERLAKYARQQFGTTSITHKWSDMDYLPYDSFPLVGKVYPWSKHMYQGTGYMKWGLSNGTAAAIILHDLVLGQQNPWARYFNSMRLRPVLNIPRAVLKHFTK